MHTVPKSKTPKAPTDAELQDVLKDLQKQAAEIHIKELEYEIQVFHRKIESPTVLEPKGADYKAQLASELGKKEKELNGCKADYKQKYA
jgi:hypothetical protein